MKNNVNFLLLTLITLMLTSISCTRTEEFGGGLGVAGSEQKLKAGITGRVTDQNHLPIKNAMVTAYGKVVQTDINGEFKFQSLTMPKHFGYV